ncbi:hypothetical protein CB1_001435031 [Camelus ferus]|nr:hypothetical protein CB1_001435031 [Camelus ferus]
MKKMEDNNTLAFIVDVKANKRQIKQAVKELCDTDVAKVHTLIMPDGENKAHEEAGATFAIKQEDVINGMASPLTNGLLTLSSVLNFTNPPESLRN